MQAFNKSRNIEHASAQGRLGELHPVAVLDIGSNSVRQVIYEGLSLAPSVLFNEKVLCGLGKGIATTGKMDEEGVKRALAAIRRFKALGEQATVENTHILATAAAREAENGPEFIKAIEEIMGSPVELLTGKKEAEYSAMGIMSGFYRPNGIVGDMGGGSLELIGVQTRLTGGETMPLGGLRLQELSGGNLSEARKIAKKELGNSQTQWPGDPRAFYAVGGTWRALARLHMEFVDYPLSVVHHYEVAASEMIEFCARVAEGKTDKLLSKSRISKNRQQLLPFGAIVMEETLKRLGADRVFMSSLGVREGYLYSQISDEEREKDALLEATRDLAILRARSPRHSRELADWTGHAFEVLELDESEAEFRYRKAACYLADIAWRAHNEYRADQSLATISNSGLVCIDHQGRAMVSLANFFRYQGLSSKVPIPTIGKIATDRTLKRARILAAFFRVLYQFSAAMEGVVPQIGFQRIEGNSYELIIPKQHEDLLGERPLSRIANLADEIGCEIEVRID